MGYLIERQAQVIFVTATFIKTKGKPREIVIESRPEFALVQIAGLPGKFPVPWEQVYELALKRHEENLRIEQRVTSGPKRVAGLRKKRDQ